MSRVCSVCGKAKLSGNKVSHSNRKTPRSYNANVQKVRVVNDGVATTTDKMTDKSTKFAASFCPLPTISA